MHNITLLGATGSIGRNALDVILRHPDNYRIHALTANKNIPLLVEQSHHFHAQYAVVANSQQHTELKEALAGSETIALAGEESLIQVASSSSVDTVIAGIVGIAGLIPTLAAVQAGKRILLANKEVLVVAGGYFMRQVKQYHAILLPVDSEHNAIHQCLHHHSQSNLATVDGVEKIFLTASGGPFLNTPNAQLSQVTPEQACKHPNWEMGEKISVDSATMMNKGLEVIEARWLFGSQLHYDILIHPQSIIHALIQFKDGGVIAQLANPDMRVALAYALAYPERIESGAERLDLSSCSDLQFHKVDTQQFPCVNLAYNAFEKGESSMIVLNASNEIAVEAFLDKRLRFDYIPKVVETVLEKMPEYSIDGLETILETDQEARNLTMQTCQSLQL